MLVCHTPPYLLRMSNYHQLKSVTSSLELTLHYFSQATSNLEIITGAHVTRLIAKVIAEDGDPWNALELDPNAPTLVVHGVEYLKEGKLLIAPPRKEVFLCAGMMRSAFKHCFSI